MNTTKIIVDRLAASLAAQGVKLGRSQVLESAAMAFGYRDSNEFAVAVRKGDIAPPAAVPLGRVQVGDETLIALHDPLSGATYAIEAGFVAGPVEDERREKYGPSPYGGLLDLSAVAGDEATSRDVPAAPFEGMPYAAFDAEGTQITRSDDLQELKDAFRSDLDTVIVDHPNRMLMRAKYGWRAEPLPGIATDERSRNEAAMRQMLSASKAEDLGNEVSGLIATAPDWRTWERDLKKASTHGKGPIDDETLYRLRHAVADNTCKSSEGERSTVRYRSQRYVERHLGGLLARLDAAEQALEDAGLRPATARSLSETEAQARLAAIESVVPLKAGTPIPGLYRVDATRDGSICRETFQVADGEDPEDKGREIAAKEFRMDIEEYVNDEGFLDEMSFDSECDTFNVETVDVTEAEAILTDTLHEIADLGLSHPARIKILAARESIRAAA